LPGLAGDRAPRGFLTGYIDAAHPVMREVSAAIEAVTDWPLASAPRATDGCSIPTFGVPLRHLARAFVRVATGIGLSEGRAAAARRLRLAAAQAPRMVGGSGRFDTRVMALFGARVFCKVGAEGMYCAALPEAGLGIALKMDDGNTSRAAEVVMAVLLQALVEAHTDAESALLAELAAPTLRNWRGLAVGRLAPHEGLQREAKRARA